MLEYNEILPHKFIILDGTPYEVLDAHVFRKQQRKPVNHTKLKNLLTGKVTERAFQSSDKVYEADIVEKPIKYLYTNKGEWWFCEEKNPSKRFVLKDEMVGPQGAFLKQNSIISILVFDEQTIGLKLPVKVVLEVKDAPPAVKGNTAQGGTKVITLETGATINAPMFINPKDKVRINTESGEYVERVNE
ncbi:MAG: elongation factor P [Patescibacteria group bacterium]